MEPGTLLTASRLDRRKDESICARLTAPAPDGQPVKEPREQIGIGPGDDVAFEPVDDGIVVRRAGERPPHAAARTINRISLIVQCFLTYIRVRSSVGHKTTDTTVARVGN